MEINNMTPENFCYWLNGYFEIGKSDILNKVQIKEIKNHLELVLTKKTPFLQSTIYNRGETSSSAPMKITC